MTNFLHSDKAAFEYGRGLIENGSLSTASMISMLSTTKKKRRFEVAFNWVTFTGLGMHVLGSALLLLDAKYHYLSENEHQAVVTVFTTIMSTGLIVAFILGLLCILELFRNGELFQSQKIDQQIVQERTLIEKLKQFAISNAQMYEHGNRLAFSVKQWRERTALVAIFSAIAAGLQVLTTATGISIFTQIGWSLVIGGGTGAILLKIHADRFERLSRVLLSVPQQSATVSSRVTNASRRKQSLVLR